MVAALVCIAIQLGVRQVPARENRAAFCHAMSQIKQDATEAQVTSLLGRPDDVTTWGDEVDWRYGTNGPGTFATLGTIWISDHKVLAVIGGTGEPPPPSVIGETELVASMRQLDRLSNRDLAVRGKVEDPRILIRAANLLIDIGRAKALAVLSEYSRLSSRAQWLFWLARVAFTSNAPGGVFPVPIIGLIDPDPPRDLTDWPTFPVAIFEDVPFCLYQDALIRGAGEGFGSYLQKNKSEWKLRATPLHPPDDPFPAEKKLVASAVWPFRRVDPTPCNPGPERISLDQVLNLVQTAYRPDPQHASVLDYDRCHKEFLALGCYWSSARQMYVRKNGSTFPEPTPNAR